MRSYRVTAAFAAVFLSMTSAASCPGSANTGAASRSAAARRRDPEAADACTGRQEEIRRQEEVGLAGAAAGRRLAAPAPETINPNSVYGSPAAGGAAERAYESAISPVNPTQLVPTNLQGFSSSATHITAQDHRRAPAAQRQRGADARSRRHRHQRRRQRPPRRHRRARLASAALAQDAGHGGRPHRQPGAVARPVGALLGADGAHGKHRGASAARSSPTVPTTTSASSTRATCRRSDPTRRSSARPSASPAARRVCSRSKCGDVIEGAITRQLDRKSPIAGTCTRARRAGNVGLVALLHRRRRSGLLGHRAAARSTTSTVPSAGRARPRTSSCRPSMHASGTTTTSRTSSVATRANLLPDEARRGAERMRESRARRAAVLRGGHCKTCFAPGCRHQHLHRRRVARPDRAQRLSRRRHDDHLAASMPATIAATAIRSSRWRTIRPIPSGEPGSARCSSDGIFDGEDEVYLRRRHHVRPSAHVPPPGWRGARRVGQPQRCSASSRISRPASATNTRT